MSGELHSHLSSATATRSTQDVLMDPPGYAGRHHRFDDPFAKIEQHYVEKDGLLLFRKGSDVRVSRAPELGFACAAGRLDVTPPRFDGR